MSFVTIRSMIALCGGAVLAAMLGGCKEETLAKCVLQGEQITAARRMTASAKLRETIDFCEKDVQWGRDFCEATYLNANGNVRTCMEAEYYAFKNIDSGFGDCTYEKFKNPDCYGLKPVLQLSKFLAAK
jgi:hypothetical protein